MMTENSRMTESTKGCDHRDNLMPPPRNVHRNATTGELLRAIEEGKVECSLPSPEALADWIRRRRINVDRAVIAQPVSNSSPLVASQKMSIGVSSAGTSASGRLTSRSVELDVVHDDVDDVLDKAVAPIDGSMPVLYHQISEESIPDDDYSSNRNRYRLFAQNSRDGRRETERPSPKNWKPYSGNNKRRYLEVGLSRHNTSTSKLRFDDDDSEEDRKKHQDPRINTSRNRRQGGSTHHLEHQNKGPVSFSRTCQRPHRDGDFTSATGNAEVAQNEGIKVGLKEKHNGSDGDCEDVHRTMPSSTRKRSRIDESDSTKTIPAVTPSFNEIIGHQAVKLRMDEILLPLALPPSLAKSILKGIRAYSPSLLLYGPPGCGKTKLAKALAAEARASFLPIGPSDVLSKFVGESEASIRSLFIQAVHNAHQMESKCAVIFFDEIDALGQSRGRNIASDGTRSPTGPSGSDNSGAIGGTCSRTILAELLIQLTRVNDLNGNLPMEDCSVMNSHGEGDENDHIIHKGKIPFDVTSKNEACPFDGLDNNTVVAEEEVNENSGESMKEVRIIVVAATNRPEDCDPALLRRFSVRAFVGLPRKRDRVQMLKRLTEGIEHRLSEQDFARLANATDEWSGSDLESLTRDAVMAPIRQCIRSAVQMKRRMPPLRTPQKGLLQKVKALSMCDNEEEHDSKIDCPYQESRRRLIQQFQTLRPVTIEDFIEALTVWAGLNNSWPGSHNPKLPGEKSENHTVHYDSSSDDDDES